MAAIYDDFMQFDAITWHEWNAIMVISHVGFSTQNSSKSLDFYQWGLGMYWYAFWYHLSPIFAVPWIAWG